MKLRKELDGNKVTSISSLPRPTSTTAQEPRQGLEDQTVNYFSVEGCLWPEQMLSDKSLIATPAEPGHQERKHFYEHVLSLHPQTSR